MFGPPQSPQKPLPGARNRPLGPRNEVPEPSRKISRRPQNTKIPSTVPTDRHKMFPNDYGPISACFPQQYEIAQPTGFSKHGVWADRNTSTFGCLASSDVTDPLFKQRARSTDDFRAARTPWIKTMGGPGGPGRASPRPKVAPRPEQSHKSRPQLGHGVPHLSFCPPIQKVPYDPLRGEGLVLINDRPPKRSTS